MLAVILPSENQVREFDAKLLLACCLAERGARVFVGARHEIHNRIASFPPSVYVAKDFRRQSERILSIISGLGHRIVAWDEEGFVQPIPELYRRRRFSPVASSHIEIFFAWGDANARLLKATSSGLAEKTMVTGNPRLDMLRPELRPFHAPQVDEIGKRLGTFVLFNSNFGSLNPKIAASSIAETNAPDPIRNFWDYRKFVFSELKSLLPQLAKSLGDTRLVIRPHPAEDHRLWEQLMAAHPNCIVLHEGSVLPWILAAAATLHSSCTTGIEAFLLGRQSLSFLPAGQMAPVEDLPDVLSEKAHSSTEAVNRILGRVEGTEPPVPTDVQLHAIRDAAAASEGKLASDRIGDTLHSMLQGGSAGRRRLLPALAAGARAAEKRITSMMPGHKTGREANFHRYPGLTQTEVAERIARLSQCLNRFQSVQTRALGGQVFEIVGP